MAHITNGNENTSKLCSTQSQEEFATADICDGNAPLLLTGELQVLHPIFQSYGGRKAFSGRVTTLKTFEDNGVLIDTLSQDEPQHQPTPKVLVIDAGGSLRHAISGGILAQRAHDMGWAGVVVNGCIRDVEEIDAINIGYKALGTCPVRPVRKEGTGEKNVPVRFAGALIRDGDWLYADSSGILVSRYELSALGRAYRPVLQETGTGTRFYSHIMADYLSHVEPYRLFMAHCHDSHNFMPKYLPQIFKAAEFVHGDSTGVGCIKLVHFSKGEFKYAKYRVDEIDVENLYMKHTIIEGDILGDKWDCIVYEIKIEHFNDSSHLKFIGYYYARKDAAPTEEDVKSTQVNFKEIQKDVQEVLFFNPRVYA